MASTRSSARVVDRVEERLPERVRVVVEKARGQDILLFASGLSFYALVSLVPLAIFVVWITSLVLGDQHNPVGPGRPVTLGHEKAGQRTALHD